jgi:hypothetical protein
MPLEHRGHERAGVVGGSSTPLSLTASRIRRRGSAGSGSSRPLVSSSGKQRASLDIDSLLRPGLRTPQAGRLVWAGQDRQPRYCGWICRRRSPPCPRRPRRR